MTIGRIEVICGPMFSGKTEELISRVNKLQVVGKRTGIFKPALDIRYHVTNIVSHNDNNLSSIPIDSSSQILELLKNWEVVAIDEAQFFDAALPRVCEELARLGIKVIIAGLDMDSKGNPFGPMPNLLAIADEIIKLQAICQVCGRPATHTYRKNSLNDTVLLGDSDIYEARCRVCFMKN